MCAFQIYMGRENTEQMQILQTDTKIKEYHQGNMQSTQFPLISPTAAIHWPVLPSIKDHQN